MTELGLEVNRNEETENMETVNVSEGSAEVKKEEPRPNSGMSKRAKIGLILLIAVLVLLTGLLAAMEFAPHFRKAVITFFTAGNGVGENTTPSEVPDPTRTVQSGNEKEGTPAPTQIPMEEIHYLENLDNEAAIANQQELHGFTAIAETINGKKYLTFDDGTYRVSYKHDVSILSFESPFEVIVSNGEKTEVFYWEYYLEGGRVADLCPVVGDYCGNGREQLVFSFFERESSEANYLHVVAGNSLMEYYFISPDEVLSGLVLAGEYLDAGRAVIAHLVAEGRNYYVALPECAPELAEELYAVRAMTKLRYTVTADEISVQSYVELGAGNYVGEIRGKVQFASSDLFCVMNPSFYLYAEDEFTDLDSMAVTEPLEEAELAKERFYVTGTAGERLLVPVREDMAKHNYKPENFEKDENGIMAYYENGIKLTLTGIDVSKWQYDINWDKVAKAGIDYAIIRLGFRGTASAGKTAIDPYYVQNIEGALKAGLKVGVYYFTQARTVEEAVEEANIVIENLKGYDVTFPVVYDTEYTADGRANALSNAERTACAKAFCDTILAAGYTPVIYANTNWSVLNLNMEELQGYDFWYAYYGEELRYPYEFTMWQYSDTGKVDGISGDVDLNISFVDYSRR